MSARATRVLNGLAGVLQPGICVDEVTKAGVQLYVEKRQRDGLKAQSTDRELNIVAAMFNSVDLYDSRHTATTHLLENGASPATVKEWMGWSDSAFVLYYSHATEKSMEKAGRSLERLAGKKVA